MKTFTGKQTKINGLWYPVTVKAHSLKEANEKIKSNNPKKGRFIIEK